MTQPSKAKIKLRYIRPADMLHFANVACDPPLGQTTTVPYGKTTVTFTVLIESSTSLSEQPWEAVIWHNGHENREWRELAMVEATADPAPLAISSKVRSKVYRRYFSIDLPKPVDTFHPVQFTLKYRTTSSQNWKWVNENPSLRDGELCFQPAKPPGELSDYLRDYSSDLKVQSVLSEAPGALLWSITAPVKPAQNDQSGYTTTSLGTPRSYTRWFAEVRPWMPWLAPRHGKEPFNVPQAAVMCAFQRWDGLSLVIVAVSGVDDVLCEINPDGEGNVIVNSRNDREESGTANIIAAVAADFEVANAACMYYARKVVARVEAPLNEKVEAALKEHMKEDKDIRAQWMENWYDGLTYCTWNALGQNLDEDRIYNALNILKEKKIFVTNLIIDDNWQSLDAVQGPGGNQTDWAWSEFDANKKGFPKGLKYTATKIRDEHPNIEHIAVWHALLGYWGAVSPKGKIAKEYKTKTVTRGGGMSGDGEWCVVHEDDVDRMYDDFYKFLLSCGVDSVKTDAQFMLDQIHDASDRRALMTSYQDAWIIAALRYFSIKVISCMSQFPQDLFHTQLPLKKPRFMVRNSDDFFPDVASSHPFHIWTNAHNSVFTQHLNVLPDWDMFQTSHDYSGFHAAGRCVSGGPIYITDYPGEHDIDLINQMTAPTTHGKSVVLRPSTFGKTTNVYTAYEEERLLKVGTYTGSKETGTSILALFNISQRSLTELVNLAAFPGIEPEQEYIVRAHTTSEISPALTLSSSKHPPVISLEVDVKSYEILSAYPLRSFTLSGSTGLSSSATRIALLGLLGKMTGAAAITSSSMHVEGNGRVKITVALKAMGVLGVYVSTLAGRKIERDVLVLMAGKVVPRETVRISKEVGEVLEVDVEAAWEAVGGGPTASNEVGVEILMH